MPALRLARDQKIGLGQATMQYFMDQSLKDILIFTPGSAASAFFCYDVLQAIDDFFDCLRNELMPTSMYHPLLFLADAFEEESGNFPPDDPVLEGIDIGNNTQKFFKGNRTTW